MSKIHYEKSLWQMLKNNCPANILLDRVEAKMPLGLPDVQGCSKNRYCGIFQIELKSIDQWPLAQTRLGVRPEQRLYLNKRGSYKQPVFLFARVGNEFLLVHGSNVEDQTKNEWHEKALKVWYKQVDWKEFYNLIFLYYY